MFIVILLTTTTAFNEEIKKVRNLHQIPDLKIYNSIDSIEFEFKGYKVIKMQWDSLNNNLIQSSWNNWENCMDIEYIKFLSWYNN